MMTACSILSVLVIMTEQNPLKLDLTLLSLSSLLLSESPRFSAGQTAPWHKYDKRTFSMLCRSEIEQTVRQVDVVFSGGIEAHIIILQTCMSISR
jgi:hypothetical protein